jgi:hypothetical protein
MEWPDLASTTVCSAKQDDSVVDHVKQDGGREASCLFEKKCIGYPKERDGEPGERRMIHGEEGGASEYGAPAAPLAIESTVEQAAE